MKTKRSHEGYYVIDHSASPGNAQVPEGAVFEAPAFRCPHCHAIVIVHPQRMRPRHYCAKCDAYTCDTPGCVIECRNLTKLLDELQEQAFRDLNRKEI